MSLNKLEGPLFAKMAYEAVLIKAGKELTLYSFIV
jgi:hypothetical protein